MSLCQAQFPKQKFEVNSSDASLVRTEASNSDASLVHTEASNIAPNKHALSFILAVRVVPVLQAKPFINEAHVFNDAGLSFDVWPPSTGSSASDAPPKPVAINPADDSSNPSDPMASSDNSTPGHEDHICLADHAVAAEEDRHSDVQLGKNGAVGGLASLTSDSSVGVGEVVGSDMGISRGYLLAVKLWEEVIATVNAKHRSSAHLGAE